MCWLQKQLSFIIQTKYNRRISISVCVDRTYRSDMQNLVKLLCLTLHLSWLVFSCRGLSTAAKRSGRIVAVTDVETEEGARWVALLHNWCPLAITSFGLSPLLAGSKCCNCISLNIFQLLCGENTRSIEFFSEFTIPIISGSSSFLLRTLIPLFSWQICCSTRVLCTEESVYFFLFLSVEGTGVTWLTVRSFSTECLHND